MPLQRAGYVTDIDIIYIYGYVCIDDDDVANEMKSVMCKKMLSKETFSPRTTIFSQLIGIGNRRAIVYVECHAELFRVLTNLTFAVFKYDFLVLRTIF